MRKSRTRFTAGPLLCAVLAAAGSSCRTAGLVAHLPPDLPNVSRWERSTGWAELGDPRRTVEYELYVQPGRPAVYAVARYRVRPLEAGRVDAFAVAEKLQWDVGYPDVRRYACEPLARDGQACRWRELARGSAEYDQEMPVLLSVYALHARLLRERDAREGR